MFAFTGLVTAGYFTATTCGRQSGCKKQTRGIVIRGSFVESELLGPETQVETEAQAECYEE